MTGTSNQQVLKDWDIMPPVEHSGGRRSKLVEALQIVLPLVMPYMIRFRPLAGNMTGITTFQLEVVSASFVVPIVVKFFHTDRLGFLESKKAE